MTRRGRGLLFSWGSECLRSHCWPAELSSPARCAHTSGSRATIFSVGNCAQRIRRLAATPCARKPTAPLSQTVSGTHAICVSPGSLIHPDTRSLSGGLSAQPPHDLMGHLRNRIHDVGPLTVADYMRESLTNPVGGYYMKGGMIGAAGDFITSPEISQIFGELVGVWHVAQWMAAGQPEKIQLVELGPGKGTMMSDMLRAMSTFPIISSVSVHLVEASPTLREAQYDKLCTTPVPDHKAPPPRSSAPRSDEAHQSLVGPQVMWHDDLSGVPNDTDSYTMIVGHEFFDALPIHQFEALGGQWHERLVGLSDNRLAVKEKNVGSCESGLCFTLAPSKTATQRLAEALGHLPLEPPPSDGALIEVCLDAVRICNEIRRRLSTDSGGGSVLVIDYGDSAIVKETLRAFKNHKEVGVLEAPGTADLTSDVNFGHLASLFTAPSFDSPPASMYGPITQRQFLLSMAIGPRAEALCKNLGPRESNAIKLQVHKLIEEMGTRFKFAAVVTDGASAEPIPVFQ